MLEQTVRMHQSGPDAPPVDQPRLREDARRLRVAYVMSRFPKLTETFILNEMTAMEEAGVEVVERIALHADSNPHNEKYLQTKGSKLGHLFEGHQ